MIKHIVYYIVLITFLLLGSCQRSMLDDVDSPDSQHVTLYMNFNPTFGNMSLSTRSTEIKIATSRETKLKNGTLLVFENFYPTTDGNPDPTGRLLAIEAATDNGNNTYALKMLPIEDTPIVLVAIANLPEHILDSLYDRYDQGNTEAGFASSDYITYQDFISITRIKLDVDYSGEKSTIAASETFLKNADDGLLPISIDPIMLPELTHQSATTLPSSTSSFAYTRIDVVVEADTPEAGSMIELVEACLVSVPTQPLYFGDVSSVEYVDHTRLINRSTNLNTPEQPNAESEDNYHLIQGLYTYPIQPKERQIHKAYAVVKAKTSVSEGDGEYYKILIQYADPDDPTGNTREYSLFRDVRYRLVIKEFIGNGYATLNEAIDGEPSNVRHEIEVDASKGNEFVITNGSLYMALSNTEIDVFSSLFQMTDTEFVGFTIFYAKNSTAGDIADPKKYISVEQGSGVEVVDAENFNTNLKNDSTYSVRLKITNPVEFANSGNTSVITVRVGDLVQKITLRLNPFLDSQTVITKYDDPATASDYVYSYFAPDSLNDYKTWILFNGNNVMEYSGKDGNGIPLSFASLQDGQRNNFNCPIYVYNKNGSSIRVLLAQERYTDVDFSDAGEVQDFLSIDNGDVAEDSLIISNCYILNPSTKETLRFFIPISSRIEQFMNGGYFASTDTKPTLPYTLPENWNVKITYYDSQRIYDGQLVVEKAEANENGEERFSVVIPANFQTYGTMLVTVYIPDAEGSTTGDMLWHWTIWVTDYNPYEILSSVPNASGVGVYTAGGGFIDYSTVTTPTILPTRFDKAIHRYGGTSWSSTTERGDNIGRFIMDRNLGAFNSTFAGHGGFIDAGGGTPADPVSGWLSFQYANICPFPGAGAVGPDGKSISIPTVGEYATFMDGIDNPTSFYIGNPNAYSNWVSVAGITDNRSYVGFDKTLLSSNSESYNKKAIFDQSPLGFMIPSFYTFYDFSSTTVRYDVGWPMQTAGVYRGFAYHYLVGYRTSLDGSIRRGKSGYGGVFQRDSYTANSGWETYSTTITGSNSYRSPSIDVDALAGMGGAIQLRPVTQFRYDN